VDPIQHRIDQSDAEMRQILAEPVDSFTDWFKNLERGEQVAHIARFVFIGLAWIPPLAYYRSRRTWNELRSTHALRLEQAHFRLIEAKQVQDILRGAKAGAVSRGEVRFATECISRWSDETRESTRKMKEEHDRRMAAMAAESEERTRRHNATMKKLEAVSGFLDMLPGSTRDGPSVSVADSSEPTVAAGGSAKVIRIYRGSPYGTPMLTLVDRHVFEGIAVRGYPLYTVRGNQLFGGSSDAGVPLASLSGGRVFKGSATAGSPLATLSGDKVFAGMAVSGAVAVSSSESNAQALLAGAYHELA
jgi:hypothetical protein